MGCRFVTDNIILLSSGSLARELVQKITENEIVRGKIIDHLVFCRKLSLHEEWMKTNPLGKKISISYKNLERFLIETINHKENLKQEKLNNIESSI